MRATVTQTKTYYSINANDTGTNSEICIRFYSLEAHHQQDGLPKCQVEWYTKDGLHIEECGSYMELFKVLEDRAFASDFVIAQVSVGINWQYQELMQNFI